MSSHPTDFFLFLFCRIISQSYQIKVLDTLSKLCALPCLLLLLRIADSVLYEYKWALSHVVLSFFFLPLRVCGSIDNTLWQRTRSEALHCDRNRHLKLINESATKHLILLQQSPYRPVFPDELGDLRSDKRGKISQLEGRGVATGLSLLMAEL